MSQIGYLGAPIFQGIDAEGIPIAGGLLWCYEAGSDVEKDMFGTISDAINGLNPLPNPMTLNAAGRASIVYSGASKFILEGNDVDPNTGHGTVIWTADNIASFGNAVLDSDGNIIVDYGSVSDSANYLKFSNAATGQRPIIDFTGTDANVGGLVRFKGSTKSLKLQNDAGSYEFPVTDGAVGYVMSTNGAGVLSWIAPSGGGGGGTTIVPGFVMDYAGTGSPTGGWLLCDGAVVSRVTYSDLFAAIGTAWGVGDGVNTFGIPDLRRRVRVGAGGTGTTVLGNAVGNVGGSETHTLIEAEMPAHSHTYSRTPAITGLRGTTVSGISIDPEYTDNTSVKGAGAAHNNMQPSAVFRAFIKI